MQREITKSTNLLDEKGRILKPGYAKKMHYIYNRKNIRANIFALKEWDFYQIREGDWILQLTIGHVSYTASISASLFNIKTGERKGFSRLRLLPLRNLPMPRNPEIPNTLIVKGKDYFVSYEVGKKKRHLIVTAKDKNGDVKIDITLNNNMQNEKMVIATPFEKPTRFYLNYKENFWGASGRVSIGDRTIDLTDDTTALIDWGRGVWPFKQEWFWGNCTAFINGSHFGFNIGWGFGDLKNATENMYFYKNIAHKLGTLNVTRDEDDYMKPWHFVSDDGSFDVEMSPIYDNFSQLKFLFIDTQCHQVFGLFNGTVKLPDGTKIILKDTIAFCEHAQNRW